MDIKLTRSDCYLILLFLIIAVPVTFSGYDYSKGLFQPIADTIIYTVFTLSVSYIVVYKLFPIYFPKQQIVKLFALTVPVMMVAGVIEILLYEFVEAESLAKISWSKVVENLKKPTLWFWGISYSSQNTGILIGILLGKKFYEAQLSLQEKEKEKRESELRLLKSQVDPHFLFNNLNTIDSLIDTKPDIAKTYLNKLSQLYRYLIRTKDDEVVPIEDELTFAKNYIYLLEQRYGQAYTFEINITGDLDTMLIPPGALQTLLENVVKHNHGDNSAPIHTAITIQPNEITVSNNINLKKTKRESYGIGLSNLKSRYKLLSDDPMKINSGQQFTVSLPNLKAIQ